MDKVLIKDIAEVVNGSTPSTKENSYWDGNIPWITPKDLSAFSGRYISSGERNITKEGYLSCSTTLVPKNTILLTSRAPIGYLAIAKNDLCTNQGFKSLICNQSKVLPLYLFYWLSTKIEFLKSISGGATFKELSKTSLENVVMDLPNIVQQQHIVDTIGSIDDLMEKNEEIIANARSLINAFYDTIIVETGISILKDFFVITIGRTPPTKESKWFSSSSRGNVKWLSIKDMAQNSTYIFETSQFLTKDALKKFNIPIVKEGDVLLSFKLTVGRTAIAGANMVTNEAIACFKADFEYRNYLFCYLQRCNFLSDGDNTSSIGKAVNSTIIKNFPFAIPSKESLNTFNKKTHSLFELIKLKQKENISLKTQKATLLCKYFSSN